MDLSYALYVHIQKTTTTYCRKLGLSREDAEDLTHDICLELHDRLAEAQATGRIRNLAGFLYTVVSHKAIDIQRLRRKEKTAMLNFEGFLDKFDTSLVDVLFNQAQFHPEVFEEYIRKHPRAFSRQNKELWNMAKSGKYTKEEMRKKMNLSKGAFSTALNRFVEKGKSIYKSIDQLH